MAVSRPCLRCGAWHDAVLPCDQATALQAFASTPPDRQAEVDAAETLAMIRYRLRTRS
jgi:hypothetical protein